MNKPTTEKKVARRERRFEWIWEVLLVVSITPAIAYGVASLNYLPVV